MPINRDPLIIPIYPDLYTKKRKPALSALQTAFPSLIQILSQPYIKL